MWPMFRIDIEFGMVRVLNVPKMPRIGVVIGSPVGAGGACICAAYREECSLRLESTVVRAELKARCYIRRWLDDLWLNFRRVMSRAAREYLALLRSPGFYGGKLRTQRVLEPEAFGFALHLSRTEGLVTRARLPFVAEGRNRPGPGWREKRSTLAGGSQFRLTRTDIAVCSGHLSRYMDLSTESPHMFEWGLMRVIAELRTVGTQLQALRTAVRKFVFGTHQAQRGVLVVVDWTAEECLRFSQCYDFMDERLRLDTQRRMLALTVNWGSRL